MKPKKKFLKKYGSDCICIDGTHGLNNYGFELITLLIIDDLREGFPCAFLISNRSDEAILKIFFSLIFEQIGKISPRVFMSEMAEAFYNAHIPHQKCAYIVPGMLTMHGERILKKLKILRSKSMFIKFYECY